MLSVKEEVETVAGFGCHYRVIRRTWYLIGVPVWRSILTKRSP